MEEKLTRKEEINLLHVHSSTSDEYLCHKSCSALVACDLENLSCQTWQCYIGIWAAQTL